MLVNVLVFWLTAAIPWSIKQLPCFQEFLYCPCHCSCYEKNGHSLPKAFWGDTNNICKIKPHRTRQQWNGIKTWPIQFYSQLLSLYLFKKEFTDRSNEFLLKYEMWCEAIAIITNIPHEPPMSLKLELKAFHLIPIQFQGFHLQFKQSSKWKENENGS